MLVPAHVRLITSTVAARVDRVLARPGAPLHADTIVLELSNPDLQLQALEAERQVAAAKAELVHLEATADNLQYAEESSIATVETGLGEARRRAAADAKLASRGFLSDLEVGQSNASVSEQTVRLEAERHRLGALGRGRNAQVEAQRAQVVRLDAIAGFRRQQVEELRVRAGVEGVLQELTLEVGQWITPGTVLARLAEPGGLKAELRVPEVFAKDVLIGQSVRVDTRNAVVDGHVSRVYPGVVAGAVKVEIELSDPRLANARADQNVEGSIEIERITETTFVSRPALGEPGTTASLFRLSPDGEEAVRVPVRFGRGSSKSIEVLEGLAAGDRVVISAPSPSWAEAARIRLR